MADFPNLLPLVRTPEDISSCKYLGLAAIEYRNRAGGTEPFLYPQEGMHVSTQFMPFMGAPPALSLGYASIISPATTGTLIAAKQKTRYWLRNVTFAANLVGAGTNPSRVYLRGYVDSYAFLSLLDEVILSRVGAAYLTDSISACHDLNMLTTENTAVTALADNMNTEIYLRYNEVQVL